MQPASDISLSLLPQREGAAEKGCNIGSSSAPLSSLYFANLMFYQAYCQGRPQNALLRNQNAGLYSCY